jgi:hypothetical protein
MSFEEETKGNTRLQIFLMLNPNIRKEKRNTWMIDYGSWIKEQIREASNDKHESIYYSQWYENRISDHNKFNDYLVKKFNYKQEA